jgi:hypothetical protein
MQERHARPKLYGRRCRRWRNNWRRPNMRWSYDYEWVVMIIVKLVSWLCFGVGYWIIVWCLLLVGGLVVWTLWWWVAMRCHLIMLIWFNLFQIDSSVLTIWNSYALQWRPLRIEVKDWHRVLTDELVWVTGICVHDPNSFVSSIVTIRNSYALRKNNGGMVIIDREEGSSDWGNSGILMFRKEDRPSRKKEEKLRCCLFGLTQNRMICSFDGLQEGPPWERIV